MTLNVCDIRPEFVELTDTCVAEQYLYKLLWRPDTIVVRRSDETEAWPGPVVVIAGGDWSTYPNVPLD